MLNSSSYTNNFKVDDCLTLSAIPTKLPEVSNPTLTVAIPIKLSLTLAINKV